MRLLISLFSALVMLSSSLAHSDNLIRILAFGDSLTAGYGLKPGQGFADQLNDKLHSYSLPIRVINGGLSGDTTAGGRKRIDWLLGDNPDIVIVELGANDALRGLSPAQSKDNLRRIIQKIRLTGADVLLAGMLAPPNMGSDYESEFNQIYPQLATEMNVPLYPFFLDGVASVAALNLEDGMHPNEDGVAVIVDKILPHVMKLLD